MGSDAPVAPKFATKQEMYKWLASQTVALVDGMSRKFTPQANLIIGLSNVASLCFYTMNQFIDAAAALQHLPVNWFGFYLLQAPGILALGPFQGRVACTEIRVGRGVCGTAADSGKSLVVKNVHDFPTHIACDSTTNAEVVVPIVMDSGAVVGVIDVDSVLDGCFDEDDAAGLERVAEALAKHLEFPMTRALSVNPALQFTPASGPAGHPAVAPEPPAQLPEPPKTTVAGIPAFTIDAVRPETTVKLVGGWAFTVTRLDRIASQQELQAAESSLGIAAFPEILFGHNALRVSREAGDAEPLLKFDALDILRNAGHFFDSPAYKEEVGPQLVIPVSEGWRNAGFERFNARVDWAWRNNFFGLASAAELRPLTPGMPSVNWDLLKDTTLPIVFFDAFDFFEDDLHDHGLVKCSLKFRVMESAFLILWRHAVRVDGHALWAREVRYFNQFDVTRDGGEGKAKVPHVVVVEQLRKCAVSDSANPKWKTMPLEELCATADVCSTKEFYVDFSPQK